MKFGVLQAFGMVSAYVGAAMVPLFLAYIGPIPAPPARLVVADPAFVAFLDPGENFPQAAALSASVGATILLVVTTLWLKRRPDRVRQVRRETADAWTLTFEPDGHEGLRFGPGQFVWLTLGDTPFSLQQHPFSFSSSAERRDVAEVTIKAVGDFTHTVGRVPVGTRGPCT